MGNSKELDGTSPAGRRQLLNNGFEPVPACGKKVFAKGWTKGEITPERLLQWEAEHPEWTNTGLRTGRLCAVDIDIKNPEHAKRIANVIMGVLGETAVRRVGSKGEMLFYFNPDPIRKITVSEGE